MAESIEELEILFDRQEWDGKKWPIWLIHGMTCPTKEVLVQCVPQTLMQEFHGLLYMQMLDLFLSQRYLTPETILYLDKSTICPCMEYCSHICSGAPQSLISLIVFQRRPAYIVVLSHRRVVESLGLFYNYYQGKCSQELSSLVPHGHLNVRSTQFS